MKFHTAIAALPLTLWLASCTSAAAPPRASLDSFPRSQVVIESAQGKTRSQHRIKVWVADTNPRRTQGLMFVKHLPRGQGMLFLFGAPQPISMWMKNTLIPLDMLFIGADGRIMRIVENTTPQSLATIASMSLAVAVLELAGGESARLGLAPGDRVKHEAFTPQ